MENPLKSTTVSTEAVGDGLSVFDRERKQSFVLNATSALVFQHCDGLTSPQQLTELLRRKLNVRPAEAEQLMRLALAELRTAGLLQAGGVPMPPPAAAYSRREVLTSFTTLGLSLALVPMVAPVAEAQGAHKLIPLLECVDDNGDGTLTAHFGYLNQTNVTIHLPVGPKNMFVPGQLDYGQPEEFLPGEHLNVFSVVFPITEDLQWMLKADGDRRHQVVASVASDACPTPMPTPTPTPT
ncbi:MAG TPA: PqqD family peptide modification chaperone, partial [Thermoanaerobaculia bacterium]|nr:PqqD family peptide modification chaperone [Thermoanaerobaculia bacterium]